MPSESQLSYFKNLYDQEQQRYLNLVERGKTFLSVATLYFSALAIAADKTVPLIQTSLAAKGTYLLGLFSVSASMALILAGIGIHKYVYASDPKRIILDAELQLLSEDEFRDRRILELAAATKANAAKNERRANILRLASIALLASVLSHTLVIGIVVLHS